jgi:hypothetical protein
VKEKFTTNPKEVSDLSACWLLSHTMRRNTAEKPEKSNPESTLKSHNAIFTGVLALDRPAFNPCEHARHQLAGKWRA